MNACDREVQNQGNQLERSLVSILTNFSYVLIQNSARADNEYESGVTNRKKVSMMPRLPKFSLLVRARRLNVVDDRVNVIIISKDPKVNTADFFEHFVMLPKIQTSNPFMFALFTSFTKHIGRFLGLSIPSSQNTIKACNVFSNTQIMLTHLKRINRPRECHPRAA
ncbi:hypothetical protein RF11_09319 [Thelohanellus kitauei]|uniref:Uncharacterized protein n=1 Tax=Thelohanellus kitauei TaxID=669202 RepID=A0A0C2MT74_THEKT|nr:hypothetical protein RF11_09319 [Thelohanellus kitauei]